MNRTCTIATAVTAAAGIAVAGATTAATAAPATSTAKLSSADRAFITSNEQVNLAEIALGKIVLKRATGPRARKLAHMTISDHRKAQAVLAAVAKKDGVQLPGKPNATELKAAQHLTKVTPHVALAYFTIQVPSHKLSIKQTKAEIRNGSKPNVQKYAAYYLPVAQKHLMMAKRDLHELQNELGR